MTLRHLGITLLCLAVAGTALAAPKKTAKAKDSTPAAAADAKKTDATGSVTQTDVIGSKEAPGVSNIVPWKEKAVVIPKKEVNTSILRETLQPLDRDVLRREIELKQEISKE